jgi:hypothetical protein
MNVNVGVGNLRLAVIIDVVVVVVEDTDDVVVVVIVEEANDTSPTDAGVAGVAMGSGISVLRLDEALIVMLRALASKNVGTQSWSAGWYISFLADDGVNSGRGFQSILWKSHAAVTLVEVGSVSGKEVVWFAFLATP